MHQTLADERSGQCVQYLRTAITLPNQNVLGLMPGFSSRGYFGAKVISVYPHNAKDGYPSHQGQIILFGAAHGDVLAVLDAMSITRIRTGAVSAAAGAVAGIAYLDGAPYEVICDTVTNTICTIGGMVCDGAKSSCAGKIAAALRCGLLSYQMAQNKRVYRTGEGIVGEDIETTISNVGRMAKQGMRSTDTEILNIIIGN